MLQAEPVDRVDLDSFHELEHEFKTPLASIRALSEILRDYPDISEGERVRMLEAMLVEQARLSRTVDRVLRSRPRSTLSELMQKAS